MGFEIMNRVLEELNREEYRRGFIAKSMDDEAMGGIVDDASFCFIIQKIVPRRDHAIQIQNKFKELWSSRNESESNAPRSRSSSAGSNGSTDSLFAVTMAVERVERAPVPLMTPSSPGPSTSARVDDEHDRSPQNAEEEGNSGDSEFESFETPLTRVAPKRTNWDARLCQQPARSKRTKYQCTRVHSHRPTSPTQEENGTRSSSESE